MEQEHICKNGIAVYSNLNQHLHSVALSLYFRYGSMYEAEDINGITHFYEHCVFRNMNRLSDDSLFSAMDAHAIYANACTYKEFMSIDFTFSPSAYEFVLGLVEKVFSPIVLRPADIDTERAVIKSEIYAEDDRNSIEGIANASIWQGTTLALPILGTCTSINAITAKKLQSFQEKLFTTGDFFLCLTGCADKNMLEKLYERLESRSVQCAPQTRWNMAAVPVAFQKRNCTIIIRGASYSQVLLGFDFSCEEIPKAERDVLYKFLFNGETSLFYTELVSKKGLLYSFDATLEEYCNIGNLHVVFDCRQAKIPEALRAIAALLNSVKKGLFSLDNGRALYRRAAEQMLDDVEELNWMLAFENHINATSATFAEREEAFMRVTPARIAEIARFLFTTDNLTIVVKGDKRKTDAECIKEIFHALDACEA